MRLVLFIVILALVGTLGGIIAAPRLDPVCVLQMVAHAATDDRPGWDCLSYAAARGDVRVAGGMLADGASIDDRTADGAAPLMLAAGHGQLRMVGFLLAHGARIDAPDARGQTALHRAAREGHAAVVRHLLGSGAALNIRDRHGRTPLLLAARQAWQDNSEIARILARAGAKVTLGTYRGVTPLMAAARAGHTPVVRYLIEQGAVLEHKSDRGATALFVAVEGNHLAAAQVLLSRGANADIQVDGQAALEVALQRGYAQMANLLHASGASHYIEYATHTRLQEGQRLLAHGQPAEAVDAFSAAIALQPGNPRAFFLRAEAYAKQQKWRSARADLLLAANLQPQHVPTLTMLAKVYTETGDYDGARDTLKQLLELAPDDPNAQVLMGQALEQLGLAAQAQSHYDRACALGATGLCDR